jgi:outer membrane receptor protein involved in Fe transport
VDFDYSPGKRTIDEILPQTTGSIFSSYTVGARQYDYDVTFHGISPYLQASSNPIARLHLSGGIRYDHLGYDYETHLPLLETGSHRRPASTDVTFDHVTPNIGATWEFNSSRSLFLSYRNGFRVPSEDQLFVQGSSSNSVGLSPVRAKSYEGGLRFGVASWLRTEASIYRMDISDDILSFFNTTDFTSETSNAGRSRHWGVELGADARIASLRLEGSYSYNRHRYIEWVTATAVDYSGKEMESGPRHLANLRASIAPPGWREASLTAEWVHVGRYFTDPENEHTYAGYDLLNAYGTAPATGGVELVLRVNNIADVRYANTASFNPFVPPDQGERFTPGLPRTFFIGLSRAWGGER